MKNLFAVLIIFCAAVGSFAQNNLQKIYDTEKSFERAAAERGVRQAFLEFLADDGIIFRPNAVNGKASWQSRPETPAGLYWNPNFVDVSSNGNIGYTTGNSVYRPQGKDDPNAFYGEYATVWQRQSGGEYRAVVDLGISHDKPAAILTEWKSSPDSGREMNEKKSSAADASVGFYETAEKQSLSKAYKLYLADDARLLRDGKMPILGKQAALAELKKDKSGIRFARRSAFISAADLAYVTNYYALIDTEGKQTGGGNFLQVWKLRGGKWQIVLDVFAPTPPGK